MSDHLKATKILIEADLRLGNKNEKAISRLHEQEAYEELVVILDVFREKKIEMPKPGA